MSPGSIYLMYILYIQQAHPTTFYFFRLFPVTKLSHVLLPVIRFSCSRPDARIVTLSPTACILHQL